MSGWNNGVFLRLIVTPAAYISHLRPVNRREALPASFRSERCKREKDCRNTRVIFHSSVTYISSRSLRNDKVCMTTKCEAHINTALKTAFSVCANMKEFLCGFCTGVLPAFRIFLIVLFCVYGWKEMSINLTQNVLAENYSYLFHFSKSFSVGTTDYHCTKHRHTHTHTTHTHTHTHTHLSVYVYDESRRYRVTPQRYLPELV